MLDELLGDYMAKLTDLFKLYDKDRDGLMTRKDLGTVMHVYGKDLTEAELQDMVDKVGADGNGNIDFTGYLNLMAWAMMRTDSGSGHTDDDALKDSDKDHEGKVLVPELKHAPIQGVDKAPSADE